MPWKNDQVSAKETEKILECARKSLQAEGDFVEFGCYKGDTSILLARLLRDYEKSQPGVDKNDVKITAEKNAPANSESAFALKKLFLYDSFAGLPEKSTNDASSLGQDFQKGELETTKRALKTRFLRANLPLPIIKKAWFNELTEEDLPEIIAFAFLDGDFYDSIKTSLSLVTPRLVKNSFLLVHDYQNPALPGVAKAVSEWFDSQKFTLETYSSLAILKIRQS